MIGTAAATAPAGKVSLISAARIAIVPPVGPIVRVTLMRLRSGRVRFSTTAGDSIVIASPLISKLGGVADGSGDVGESLHPNSTAPSPRTKLLTFGSAALRMLCFVRVTRMGPSRWEYVVGVCCRCGWRRRERAYLTGDRDSSRIREACVLPNCTDETTMVAI